MLKGRKMKTKGFTLVEILIVVVILGILAAIVIPQFTNASAEAKVSRCVSDLQTLRSMVQLYKIQHSEVLPHLSAVSVAAGDPLACLLVQTDVQGNAWAAGAGTVYGPYLKKIPINPFNELTDAAGVNGSVRQDGAISANTHSWRYDSGDGYVIPDDIYDGDGNGTVDHEQFNW